MKPINREERQKAFWKFLMFFSITVGVMVTALFFSFRVPFKDNDRLRAEMAKIEQEKSYFLTFQYKMLETINLLDSLGKSGNNFPFVNTAISKKINEMSVLNDSMPDKKFYYSVIMNLQELQNAKNQLKEVSDKDNNAGELKEQVNSLTNELRQCQLNLNYCNQLLQNKK